MPLVRILQIVLITLISVFMAACASQQTPSAEKPSDNRQIESQDLQETAASKLEATQVGPSSEPTELTESLLTNLLIANLAINAQEYRLASESMAKAADESEEVTLVEKATRFALYAKQYDEAIAQGQKWIMQDPDNYLAYLVTSVAAVAGEKTSLATQMLAQLLELNPDNYSTSYKRIGEVYLQHEAGLKSLEVIKELVKLHPDLAEAWMLQAAIAQRLRNTTEMDSALNKVLSIAPHNERAGLLKLGVLQIGSLEELQAFAAKFTEDNPNVKSFKIAYGRELLKREQNDLALEQFESILETHPKDIQALNLTALVYHSLGDFENSATYFKRHIAVQPDDDQSRVYLASALHQLGRIDEANEAVETIKDESDRFNSYRQIAMHIEEIKGTDKGIAYLREIDAQDQDHQIQLIADEGHMLARAKRTQEELVLLNRSLLAFPQSTLLRYQRGLLYVELKELDGHEKDMRLLLQQDPENAHYYNTLGYSLLLEKDRLEEAEDLINKAHALKPDDPYILDSKGWLEFKLGNSQGAILYLNQAFKLDPDPEIAAHIGEVHWSLGEQEKAKAIWLDAKENNAENESLNSAIERFLE